MILGRFPPTCRPSGNTALLRFTNQWVLTHKYCTVSHSLHGPNLEHPVHHDGHRQCRYSEHHGRPAGPLQQRPHKVYVKLKHTARSTVTHCRRDQRHHELRQQERFDECERPYGEVRGQPSRESERETQKPGGKCDRELRPRKPFDHGLFLAAGLESAVAPRSCCHSRLLPAAPSPLRLSVLPVGIGTPGNPVTTASSPPRCCTIATRSLG